MNVAVSATKNANVISCPVEYPEFDSLPSTAVEAAMESRQTVEEDKLVLKNALDETKDFLSETFTLTLGIFLKYACASKFAMYHINVM
jgi:hypothetical protein